MSQTATQTQAFVQRLAEKLAKFPPRGLRNLLSELDRAEQRRDAIAVTATAHYNNGKPEALEVVVRATWDGE